MATYFSGAKLRWLLDREPALRPAAERGDAAVRHHGQLDHLEPDRWAGRSRAAGRDLHVTDVTNASRTMLMNLETLDWDDDLLAAFGIPRAMLPEIRPSIARLGRHRRPAARHPDRRGDR